jgi:hypothetical protein
MANRGRACLFWPRRADLAECRFHLVDHELLDRNIAEHYVT